MIETGLRVASDAGGAVIERGDDGALLLEGVPLTDGEAVDLITERGPIAGHIRTRLHPETGAVGFEVHAVVDAGGAVEHLPLWLPERALLRRRISVVAPTAAPAAT